MCKNHNFPAPNFPGFVYEIYICISLPSALARLFVMVHFCSSRMDPTSLSHFKISSSLPLTLLLVALKNDIHQSLPRYIAQNQHFRLELPERKYNIWTSVKWSFKIFPGIFVRSSILKMHPRANGGQHYLLYYFFLCQALIAQFLFALRQP